MKVLHLGYPTPGDHAYYTRWEEFGEVTRDFAEGKDAQILVVDHRTQVTDSIVNAMPNLKCIASPNTGTDHITMTRSDIDVVSLKGERKFLDGVRSVSEFTMSLILSLSRHLDQPGSLLSGKTIGVVGVGRIGSQVLSLAKAFGMHPLIVDIHSSKKDWDLLFTESDVISVHLPLNEFTDGIVDEEYIDMMKDDALVINTARGQIIDEEYLIERLWEGSLGGYATDVISIKPKYKPTNLLITDHIAGNTLEDRIRTDEFIVNKVKSRVRTDNQVVH